MNEYECRYFWENETGTKLTAECIIKELRKVYESIPHWGQEIKQDNRKPPLFK